jgi:hypothetical protein
MARDKDRADKADEPTHPTHPRPDLKAEVAHQTAEREREAVAGLKDAQAENAARGQAQGDASQSSRDRKVSAENHLAVLNEMRTAYPDNQVVQNHTEALIAELSQLRDNVEHPADGPPKVPDGPSGKEITPELHAAMRQAPKR